MYWHVNKIVNKEIKERMYWHVNKIVNKEIKERMYWHVNKTVNKEIKERMYWHVNKTVNKEIKERMYWHVNKTVNHSVLSKRMRMTPFLNLPTAHSPSVQSGPLFCFYEGPRSRSYGRTAALRLIAQPCDKDYHFSPLSK
jgi:hypothetical protein